MGSTLLYQHYQLHSMLNHARFSVQIAKETHNMCIINKLYDVIGAVLCSTVVSQQCTQLAIEPRAQRRAGVQ